MNPISRLKHFLKLKKRREHLVEMPGEEKSKEEENEPDSYIFKRSTDIEKVIEETAVEVLALDKNIRGILEDFSNLSERCQDFRLTVKERKELKELRAFKVFSNLLEAARVDIQEKKNE